jgi:ribosome biogenesis protein NSA1
MGESSTHTKVKQTDHIDMYRLNIFPGLSGAITSMAPSPSLLVSTALDRYCRIHTSFPPPPEAGQSQDNKGQVVEKLFMTSVPTVVTWDGVESAVTVPEPIVEDDDVWDEMENVEDSDDELKGRKKRRNAEQRDS